MYPEVRLPETVKEASIFQFLHIAKEGRTVKGLSPSWKIFYFPFLKTWDWVLRPRRSRGLGLLDSGRDTWPYIFTQGGNLENKVTPPADFFIEKPQSYVSRNHKQSACELRRQRRDEFNQVYGRSETCNHTASTGERICSSVAPACQVQPQGKHELL